MYAFVFRRIMDFDQMMPVAVAMTDAGHRVRIGVMGDELDIAGDPRLSLLRGRTRIWRLRGPLARARCAAFLCGAKALVMDWAKRDQHLTSLLTDLARTKGIPSIALPHGIDIVPDAVYYESRIDAGTFGHFDHIVTPNVLRQRILIDAGLPQKRIHVLGGMRFTRSWSDRLRTVYPARNDRREERLHVVHFDGLSPAMQESTERTLRRVAELPFTKLAIQPKPRRAGEHQRTLDRIFPDLVDTNHASQLCHWADVATFIGSSVALEMLVRGGELIWLKHLDPDPMSLEDFAACRVVESDEALVELLQALHEKRATPRPDPSTFLRVVIHGGQRDGDVLPSYTRFLEQVVADE